MPRNNSHRERVDDGDEGVTGPPSRLMNVAAAQKAQVAAKRKKVAAKSRSSDKESSSVAGAGTSSSSHTPSSSTGNGGSGDQDLEHLEQRLNEEVDEDFFEEPRRYNTLPRVIDVLGVQMIDDATVAQGPAGVAGLKQNPAYQQLRQQQTVVEAAIEHMAVIHCANLNASVISVGRVARQFNDAVEKVRVLRKQVRDIQDSLGPSSAAANHNADGKNGGGSSNPNEAPPTPDGGAGHRSSQNAAAMSLRELWLKKLECEATLALLDKLDIIRAAPARFDEFMKKSLIGAAVLCVSQALETMFRDDVAQVQALHKIMEQLMIRKQTAEEIVWDTLTDVLFLRTGNGLRNRHLLTSARGSGGGVHRNSSTKHPDDLVIIAGASTSASTAQSVSSESRRSTPIGPGATSSNHPLGGTNSNQNGGNSNNNAINHNGRNKVVIVNGMINPFITHTFRFAAVEDDDDDLFLLNAGDGGVGGGDDGDSVASDHSNASLFSIEGDVTPASNAAAAATEAAGKDAKASSATSKKRRLLIPIPMIEAELDLESDERRIQEEIALSGMATQSSLSKKGGGAGGGGHHHHGHHHHRWALPRYADPVLGLRILVECVAFLKRLDDVERHVAEQVAAEVRFLVQREQARTFARMERRQQQNQSSVVYASGLRGGTIKSSSAHGGGGGAGSGGGGKLGGGDFLSNMALREFRRHLTGLLSAFGSVLLRLSHLAQILRFRISSDRELLQKMESPTSVMRSVISSALVLMQQEIRGFLQACLKEPEQGSGSIESAVGQSTEVGGFFSLGIIEDPKGESEAAKLATATRSNVMEMPTARFTSSVLFSKTKNTPQARHALTFRRMVARWTSEIDSLKHELAFWTGEDPTTPAFNTPTKEQGALAFLDTVIKKELLPAMQEEAVNGTVLGLERRDAFDPVLDRAVYNRPNSNEPQDVDMCIACQSLYVSTGPPFLALHRLPRGDGEMYLPVVAVLEHVMLTFISRIKHQMSKLCENKTAKKVLEKEGGKASPLAFVMEKRQPFTKLLHAYTDSDMFDGATGTAVSVSATGATKLAAPAGDTPRQSGKDDAAGDAFTGEVAPGVDGEEELMLRELKYLQPYFDFANEKFIADIKVCTDEELMKAEALAHSLLKVASLLESRLKVRHSSSSYQKPLTSTRALREAIKTVMQSGLQMAKFCRLDLLFQTVTRLSKVCKSSTLVARDAVRIPSSVNDLGEYLTGASDNLREAAGNAVTAYTLSSLEQYVPHCLMETVRVVGQGKGIMQKAPLTMNGIEALDRSGSVLYRDLKGATAFDNSYWDVDLAALSFERSASFMALMELEMEELAAYYNANPTDFDQEDFMLMFSMTGPRRQGDIGRFHMLNRQRSSTTSGSGRSSRRSGSRKEKR